MTTTNNRVVLFRAEKHGTHRWQLGQINGRYCWWSHTTGQGANYKYVDTYEELLKLVEWFESKGFDVVEA